MQIALIYLFFIRPYELQKVQYRKPEVTSYPRPRSGHRIAASDRAIYLFGGFNPNVGNLEENEVANCMFKELWRFDLFSKVWTLILSEKSNLPVELASHAMHLYGDYLMVRDLGWEFCSINYDFYFRFTVARDSPLGQRYRISYMCGVRVIQLRMSMR